MAEIFVFGSNLAGRHGKGSALEALNNHGAVYGVGAGRMGNSYAIPTKNRKLKTLDLAVIEMYVKIFRHHALDNPGDTFNLVAIGCGLAGYMPHEIAPLFHAMPDNVKLPPEFKI